MRRIQPLLETVFTKVRGTVERSKAPEPVVVMEEPSSSKPKVAVKATSSSQVSKSITSVKVVVQSNDKSDDGGALMLPTHDKVRNHKS